MNIFGGWLPSRIIARYVGRRFASRTAAVLFGLVLILLVLDLIGESGRILAVPGNSGDDVLRYTWLRLPQLIAQFLPFSVLLATLLTLSELNAASEITIFKGAGISAHQILMPLFAVGAVVAVLSFTFNELVLTHTNSKLVEWKARDYADYNKADPAPREVWARDGENLAHAARIDGRDAKAVLTDLVFYDRKPDGALEAIVRAPHARKVARGWELERPSRFDVATGRIASSSEWLWRTDVQPRQFMTRDPDPDSVPFWRMPAAIAAVETAGRPTASLWAHTYHKLSQPLSALLMPLLGAVAGFGLARSGRLFIRAVIGMVLGFSFFVADNFMLAMGSFNAVPPIVAAWSPLVLFFLIGESVLLRTEE
ncbi:MAG: LPS export ABC transporter permease LptG [Sphingomonadaceae bacterium]|nr:LPS export ABC transporter permease LptG [Sphingomonadaceae bacterium]